MKPDIEIARSAKMKRISEIAKAIGISEDHYEPHGHYKAKISLEYVKSLQSRPDGKLILVTAISPTPPGEGKTTMSVGLGDALHKIGEKVMICLREPSIGPVFGLKGGATGGGYAQVVPMEDINLHFTGDFGAIQLANNLLSSLIDNHIHHGNILGIDEKRIVWRRVLDLNDRALREVTVALGGKSNGLPRQDGFDIVVASEVMAIFCLSSSLADLRKRLGNIVVAYTREQKPVHARDLFAHGAMTALLKDAIKPNLVQTIEHTPTLIHGGPFANIAHGCNSVIATRTALKLADYVVTEAGFGADLGAEKFINIKCRKSGLKPSVAVVVATVRALKYHGGVELKQLGVENLEALRKGMSNLERHLKNLRENFGLPVVVGINRFNSDTAAEIEFIQTILAEQSVPVKLCTHWADGGAGAVDLARTVIDVIKKQEPKFKFLYEDSLPLWDKINTIAKKMYGAAEVTASDAVREKIRQFQEQGYGNYPVCVAKTQYSFSTDAALLGAPSGHTINVREVRLSAGAEFIVMICGSIMTMPGLPKVAASERIDVDESGNIVGLS